MKKVLAIMLLLAILVMAVAPVTVTASQDSPVKLFAVASAQGINSGDSPDLTLSPGDIVFAPSEPVVGETVTITATIHNIGDANAKDVLVYFYANSILKGEDGIKVIPKGQSRSAEISWIPEVAGDYSITVVVDPLGTIDELYETNNEASKAITVGGAPPEEVHDVAVTSVTASPTEVTAGEVVTIIVSVENQGEATETFGVTAYYDLIAIGTQKVVDLTAGASDMLTFSWDTTGVAEGTYMISAEASTVPGETDTADNELPDGPVTVHAPAIAYELFIEIDYMVGHEPTGDVLVYIHDYYYERAIDVTFIIDDVVEDPTSGSGITGNDFWAIEAEHNDVWYYDDRAHGDLNKGVYESKEKWVLFGTTDAEYNAVGYCWVVAEGRIKLDFIAGNYMFIADETADDWAVQYLGEGNESGAEAVVLMHEMGHSIGIGEAHRFRGEVYCDNQECVMAKLSTANADNYGFWFYCDYHWAQKNLEYYES